MILLLPWPRDQSRSRGLEIFYQPPRPVGHGVRPAVGIAVRCTLREIFIPFPKRDVKANPTHPKRIHLSHRDMTENGGFGGDNLIPWC